MDSGTGIFIISQNDGCECSSKTEYISFTAENSQILIERIVCYKKNFDGKIMKILFLDNQQSDLATAYGYNWLVFPGA